MKLTNLQIKTLANRVYKQILNSSEYRERVESLQEKVDSAWEEYKVYKDIERILDKPYINNVCVLESDIAKSLKDFNEQSIDMEAIINWIVDIKVQHLKDKIREGNKALSENKWLKKQLDTKEGQIKKLQSWVDEARFLFEKLEEDGVIKKIVFNS